VVERIRERDRYGASFSIVVVAEGAHEIGHGALDCVLGHA
jgi:predicted N-acetyltransferase YhbS